ncbi:MAG: LysM peptidoglycan-binding domain-containing protein [Planctomycetes bacterium]|nr:LysM peptidoglycan-binding domain-containing protein [Planctomycetota bacterium]MCP4772543.1 LysM peptidoglycan-binding domain-containing protein [Planctomycetota bacterium]MCP4860853.1 LysM peptidoglycan-binding domain-containing protein [Planctomycetota bacterium]
MRTLLALTVLMLVLAGAVWWKTRPEENNQKLPPTTVNDSRVGVSTVGMEPGTSIPTDASFPPRPNTNPYERPNSDADGDHEGEDTKTNLAVNPPEEDPVNPTPVEPDPTPPPVVEPQVLMHTIVAGDTFYSLIRSYYGTAPESLLDAVAEANSLSDPGSLNLDQKILMPVIDGFRAPKKP